MTTPTYQYHPATPTHDAEIVRHDLWPGDDRVTACGIGMDERFIPDRPALAPVAACDRCADVRCPVCDRPNPPGSGGCDCYGATVPPARYPTADDLAAFRYRIMPDAYDCEAFDRPTVRDWERGGIPGWHTPEGRDALARREAAAMRSRAFALWTRLPRGRDRATLDELAHGAPVWPR